MIRKLTEKDRETTLEFVRRQPAENLFIIGDIETYGFNDENQEIWGAFNSWHELSAVLLRFYENFIPYTRDIASFDGEGFAAILNRHRQFKMLSGLQTILEKLFPSIEKPLGRTKDC